MAQHPRVFATDAELQKLTARINRPGSYSTQRFKVQRDVATPAEWSATYSGCDIGIYLYAFSCELQDGNAAETASPC